MLTIRAENRIGWKYYFIKEDKRWTLYDKNMMPNSFSNVSSQATELYVHLNQAIELKDIYDVIRTFADYLVPESIK